MDAPPADVVTSEAGVGKVGTLGQSCEPEGATACNGNDSVVVLICQAGAWAADGSSCPSTQRCDSTVGACADVVAACMGQHPGDEYCSGSNVMKCGVDLVTTTIVQRCGSHQSCSGSGGSATCECNVDPSCTMMGPTCSPDGTSLVTCSIDTDSCLVSSGTSACNGPCYGAAGSAACCNDTCSAVGNSCVVAGSPAYTTCAADSNGCLVGGSGACEGVGPDCVGSAGSASCQCTSSSECTGQSDGNACVNRGTAGNPIYLCGCATSSDCPGGSCCGLQNPAQAGSNAALCYTGMVGTYTCSSGSWVP